jgi:uncharacterized membrane protein SirB2
MELMTIFNVLKTLHIATVSLSLSFFLIRGLWMVRQSPHLQMKWVRIAPHIVDTLLLGSALGLSYLTHQYPFVQSWLTMKFLLLIAYILLGTIALKRGKTRKIKVICLILAILCASFIVAIALTKSPLGFLGI